jgi:hypothetical protein
VKVASVMLTWHSSASAMSILPSSLNLIFTDDRHLRSNPVRRCLVPLVFFNTYHMKCLDIWSVKHRLIMKLIAQIEINLRDESIKSN